MMALLVEVPSRNILVDLSMNYILDADVCDSWINVCPFYVVSGCHILRKILFYLNKVKNYNSMVISRGMEKRRLKNSNNTYFSLSMIVVYNAGSKRIAQNQCTYTV